jgi:hypothetical protein
MDGGAGNIVLGFQFSVLGSEILSLNKFSF